MIKFFFDLISHILFKYSSYLVYNLTHGIDVEATEAQISLYETENMQSIRERKSRVVEENRRIETLIKYEKEAATKLAQEIQVILYYIIYFYLLLLFFFF